MSNSNKKLNTGLNTGLNTELNTGWKTWDEHLSQFVGKKINIMEIGVYEGVASAWFLKNIMTNNASKFYAVDAFEGSPEYMNKIDFNQIEKTFWKNVKETGREKQVVMMKMFSNQALIKLIDKSDVMFDIIFIDASHEARDVVSDAILAWKLLKEGGVMIFDDYKWEKMVQEYFRPKLAIDSFVAIMKPELNVLAVKYQLLVQKKMAVDFEKPLVTEEYNDFIKNVNKFNKQFLTVHDDNLFVIENNTSGLSGLSGLQGIELKLETSSKLPRPSKELMKLNNVQYKIADDNNLRTLIDPLFRIYVPYYKNTYLADIKTPKKFKNSFEKFLSQRSREFTPDMYILSSLNFSHNSSTLKYLNISNTNKFVDWKTFFNNNKFYQYLVDVMKCVTRRDVTYYDINISINDNSLKKIATTKKYNSNFFSLPNKLLSVDDILHLQKIIKDKFNYLNLGSGIHPIHGRYNISEHIYMKYIFSWFIFSLVFCEKNGTAMIIMKTSFLKTTQDIMFLMSIYFDIKINTNINSSDTVQIYLTGFKGCSENDIKQYLVILQQWEKIQSSRGEALFPSNRKNIKNFELNKANLNNQDNVFVTSIISISNSSNNDYNKFVNKLNKYNDILFQKKKEYVYNVSAFVKFLSKLNNHYKQMLYIEVYTKQSINLFKFFNKTNLRQCYIKYISHNA